MELIWHQASVMLARYAELKGLKKKETVSEQIKPIPVEKPTEVKKIPTDLEERGEPIESTLEAERRRSNGERIFAITEQDGTPVEVTSVEMLRNYTPDQLMAYKPSEIIKNKELQENKLILQNGTKKQGNGKDTGAAIGSEMGGLEPSGKGAEVGLGAPSRYVVGKSDRVVRDVTTVKKISIPDSEAAEIKKVLPNAIFDDTYKEFHDEKMDPPGETDFNFVANCCSKAAADNESKTIWSGDRHITRILAALYKHSDLTNQFPQIYLRANYLPLHFNQLFPN